MYSLLKNFFFTKKGPYFCQLLCNPKQAHSKIYLLTSTFLAKMSIPKAEHICAPQVWSYYQPWPYQAIACIYYYTIFLRVKSIWAINIKRLFIQTFQYSCKYRSPSLRNPKKIWILAQRTNHLLGFSCAANQKRLQVFGGKLFLFRFDCI